MRQSYTILFSSNEVRMAANAPDRVQFLQDINRHNFPVKAQRCGALNSYTIGAFAIALCVGKMKHFGISLNTIGRLLKRVDPERLSVLIDQLAVGKISELIVLVRDSNSQESEVPTCVCSWEEVAAVSRTQGASFMPIETYEAISSKLKGIW